MRERDEARRGGEGEGVEGGGCEEGI